MPDEKRYFGGQHFKPLTDPILRTVTACIVAERTPGVATGDDDKFSRPPMSDEQWETFCKAILKVTTELVAPETFAHVTNVTMTPVMIHAYLPAGTQDKLRSALGFLSRRFSRDILLTFGVVELISSAPHSPAYSRPISIAA